MNWQTWFEHTDGSPRVVYLTIAGRTELILADTYDGPCELSIQLERGAVRQTTKIQSETPRRVADPETRTWAARTAVAYLRELAALASDTAETIETTQYLE